jgi:hypothetical protein
VYEVPEEVSITLSALRVTYIKVIKLTSMVFRRRWHRVILLPVLLKCIMTNDKFLVFGLLPLNLKSVQPTPTLNEQTVNFPKAHLRKLLGNSLAT